MIKFSIDMNYVEAVGGTIALLAAIVGAVWRALTYAHDKEISAKNEHLKMKGERIAELEQQLRSPSEYESALRMMQTLAATETTRLKEELERAKLGNDAALKAVVEEKIKREEELSADLTEARAQAAQAQRLHAEADQKLAKARTLVPRQPSPFMSLLDALGKSVVEEKRKLDATTVSLKSLIDPQYDVRQKDEIP